MLGQWHVLTYNTSDTLNTKAIANFLIMYIFSDTKYFVRRPWFPSFLWSWQAVPKIILFFCPHFWWGPSVCRAILFKSTCRNPRFMLFVLSSSKNLQQTNQRKNVAKYTFFQKLTSPPQFPFFFSLVKSDWIFLKERLVCPKPDHIFSAWNWGVWLPLENQTKYNL